MGGSFNYYSSKIHRYLGAVIGIQFLMWTIGGFYFSWTNINEIRGEHLRKETADSITTQGLVSPALAMSALAATDPANKVRGVNLRNVLGKPVYEINVSANGQHEVVLADAMTGKILPAFDEKQAVEIANRELVNPSEVIRTELLSADDVGGHHEYRDKPLPAFAITYAEPANLVVYVSRNAGKVESFRTTSWRVFDFFWLFHTLDLYTRDDINNYLLRAFSVLGLVTIGSGYLLFFVTSPWIRRRGKKITLESIDVD